MDQWVEKSLHKLASEFGYQSGAPVLLVNTKNQSMLLMSNNLVRSEFDVSTSRFGLGCEEGSNCTPTGVHRVAGKIGSDAPIGAIFIGRENTGEIADRNPGAQPTGKDLITTRILLLDGLEEGHNKGGHKDSYSRFIYIHGTSEEGLIGQPASMGCIRMRNTDVISVYDAVFEGTLVYIADPDEIS
ncbi:MAG: cell wall-recycling L,D-carboxypeptidase ElsL [Gammaproteobacteria bacterium]|nr:MAG: cell wall-recycling L,D-carboxypeptidase ElsL [Gammaproteobacteria bacterium]